MDEGLPARVYFYYKWICIRTFTFSARSLMRFSVHDLSDLCVSKNTTLSLVI